MTTHFPIGFKRARLIAALAATAAALLAAPAAQAEQVSLRLVSDGPEASDPNLDAIYKAEARGGELVVFTTKQAMAPTDTDSSVDAYARVGSAAPLHVSRGYVEAKAEVEVFVTQVSPSGEVWLGTTEKLLPSDTDALADVYMWSQGGQLVHVSDNPLGPDGPRTAYLHSLAPGGSPAYLTSAERLATTDTDDSLDAYAYSAGGDLVHLTDTPLFTDGQFDVTFRGSPDGSRVYFETREDFLPGDLDTYLDVYELGPKGPSQVSYVAGGGNGDAFFDSATAGGERVWWESATSFATSDSDTRYDAYERNPDGAVVHVSPTPAAVGPEQDVYLVGQAGGGRVLLESSGALLPGDTDAEYDVYERTAGGQLVALSDSPGTDQEQSSHLDAISPDGSRLIISSYASLLPSDTDAMSEDLYGWQNGGLTHLGEDPARADGPFDLMLAHAAPDWNPLIVETREALAGSDTDTEVDVYALFGDEAIHLSDNPVGEETNKPSFASGTSDDGRRIYLRSYERLVAEDTDDEADVYLVRLEPDPVPPAGSPAPGPDLVAPALSGLRVIEARRPKRGAPAKPGRSQPKVAFQLSEPAQVTFTLRRGRRTVGSFVGAGAAGANRVAFPPQLRRVLAAARRAPGSGARPRRRSTGLLLLAAPRDAAGNAGERRTARLAAKPNRRSKP